MKSVSYPACLFMLLFALVSCEKSELDGKDRESELVELYMTGIWDKVLHVGVRYEDGLEVENFKTSSDKDRMYFYADGRFVSRDMEGTYLSKGYKLTLTLKNGTVKVYTIKKTEGSRVTFTFEENFTENGKVVREIHEVTYALAGEL